MSAVVDVGFDYGSLSETDRAAVREAAVRIRLRMKRTVEEIIEIGRDLIGAKEKIPQGGFMLWIEAEFGMSQSAANRFMKVAERFGGKFVTVTNLAPSVLYALAAPSTPDDVVDDVKDRLANGEAVTLDDVKELKAKLKEQKDKTKEVKSKYDAAWGELESARKENERLRREKQTLEGRLETSASLSPKPLSPSDPPRNDIEVENQQHRALVRAWEGAGQGARDRFLSDIGEAAYHEGASDAPLMDRQWG